MDAFTRSGDKIIIQPPVYHLFQITIETNGRKMENNPLIQLENGYYEMDFERLETVCDEGCKILVLCNPHNPGGLC